MRKAVGLIERLRKRTDWRLTAQRRVIAETFEGEHVHLTPEQVLERARRRLPEISLATVYNTLNELVALGELQPVQAGRGRLRYDPGAGRHDHLVCVKCGEIRDVSAEGRVRLSKSQRFGYHLGGHEVVFKGYCPRCTRS